MKLKVKPLAWYMEDMSPEELLKEEYKPVAADFTLVGRNGHYCYGNDVWFEVDGIGYYSYRNTKKAREYFCYDLTVNDEASLPDREANAMEQILKTSRDAPVKKAIRNRLRLHHESLQLRDVGRRAAMFRISIINR